MIDGKRLRKYLDRGVRADQALVAMGIADLLGQVESLERIEKLYDNRTKELADRISADALKLSAREGRVKELEAANSLAVRKLDEATQKLSEARDERNAALNALDLELTHPHVTVEQPPIVGRRPRKNMRNRTDAANVLRTKRRKAAGSKA